MPKILIIEDESALTRVLRSYLEKAGMSVVSAARGDTGLSLWEHERPDLVLLDLNLPGLDGMDVAREIRRKSDTPIIMVTARVEETDRLIGLEIGADDYILKPYSPREVVARVRAVLRRSSANRSYPAALNRWGSGNRPGGAFRHPRRPIFGPDPHRILAAGNPGGPTGARFQPAAAARRQPGGGV